MAPMSWTAVGLQGAAYKALIGKATRGCKFSPALHVPTLVQVDPNTLPQVANVNLGRIRDACAGASCQRLLGIN